MRVTSSLTALSGLVAVLAATIPNWTLAMWAALAMVAFGALHTFIASGKFHFSPWKKFKAWQGDGPESEPASGVINKKYPPVSGSAAVALYEDDDEAS